MRRRRRRHPGKSGPGIRQGIDWDREPLGEMSDAKLAKLIGVAKSSVSFARVRRGIPPAHPPSPQGIVWSRQPVGRVPDSLLAWLLDVTTGMVARKRRQLGLPSAPLPQCPHCKCDFYINAKRGIPVPGRGIPKRP